MSLVDEVIAILPGLGLSACRAIGLFAILPFTSVPQVAALKFSMALGLALTFGGPSAALDVSVVEMISEFLIGVSLGLPAALVVNAAAMWAELVDGIRGQTMASFYDPISEREETAFVSLARSLVLASLLVLGLGEALVKAYHESFSLLPVAGLTLAKASDGATHIMRAVLGSLTAVTSAVIPLVVIGAVIEAAVAMISRFMPQGGFSHEGFILKSLVLFIMVLAWWRLGLESSLFLAATPRLPGSL